MTTSIPSNPPDATASTGGASLNNLLGSFALPASNASDGTSATGSATSFADLLGSSCPSQAQTSGQSAVPGETNPSAVDTTTTGGPQTLQQMLAQPSVLSGAGTKNVFASTPAPAVAATSAGGPQSLQQMLTQPPALAGSVATNASIPVPTASLAGPTAGAAASPAVASKSAGLPVRGGLGVVATLTKTIAAKSSADNSTDGSGVGDDSEASPLLNPEVKRDVAEAIAALLAPLYAALPSPPAAGAPEAAGSASVGTSGQLAAGSAGPAVADVTVDFGDGTCLRLELPAGSTGAVDVPALTDGIAAAIDRALGSPAAPKGPTTQDGLTVSTTAKSTPTVILQAAITWPDPSTAAARSGPSTSAAAQVTVRNQGQDINFLNAGPQVVGKSKKDSGISVATVGATMPTTLTSRRLTVEPLVLAPNSPAHEIMPTVPMVATTSAPVSSTETTQTPAPVLAQRAVDTILNVVESQAERSSLGGTVNLNFNFGGDNLTVRVQMRGNEVQTRFLTESTELRAALSTQWQAMTGPGTATAGLRLLDPVFSSPVATSAPTAATANSGTGAAGQESSSQQNPQQQNRAPAAFPELQTFRRGTANKAAAQTENTRPVRMPPSTSLHLAAVA